MADVIKVILYILAALIGLAIFILILYFIILPVFKWCWGINCKVCGVFGIENKIVCGIIYFLFSCISSLLSGIIAVKLSD